MLFIFMKDLLKSDQIEDSTQMTNNLGNFEVKIKRRKRRSEQKSCSCDDLSTLSFMGLSTHHNTVKLGYYVPSREMKKVRSKQSTFYPKQRKRKKKADWRCP